jgi:hypothetical protein
VNNIYSRRLFFDFNDANDDPQDVMSPIHYRGTSDFGKEDTRDEYENRIRSLWITLYMPRTIKKHLSLMEKADLL